MMSGKMFLKITSLENGPYSKIVIYIYLSTVVKAGSCIGIIEPPNTSTFMMSSGAGRLTCVPCP